MNLSSRSFNYGILATLALVLASITGAQPPPANPEKTAPAAAAPAPDTPAAPAQPEAASAPAEEPASQSRSRRKHHGPSENIPFGDHTVADGGRTQEVVSIFGSAIVEGTVDSDAVSIGGRTVIGKNGKVGGAAVAVMGRLESEGEIRDEAVSVMGGSSINGPVGGEAVAVLGNLHLGPKAVVEGDVVVIGGRLTRDPGAVVHGNEVHLPVLGGFGDMEWFVTWVKRCAFYGRLLAVGPHLGWAWMVALSFLALYLLLALLFPAPIAKCAETLETRPGASLLASVLTLLLTPVAVVLLAVTVVGALLLPFLGVALIFAQLFGKAVMLAWLGRRFTKFFGDGPLGHPVFAVLIGGIVVTFLYMVPVLGIFSYKLLSWLGLGVVVYTVKLATKRDRPPRAPLPVGGPAPLPPVQPIFRPPVMPAAMAPMNVPAAPNVSSGFTGSGLVAGPIPPIAELPPLPPSDIDPGAATGGPTPAPMPTPAFVPAAAPIAAALAWPRAGFFIRLGAFALDGVLIGLIVAFIEGVLPRFLHFNRGPGGVLLVLAAYAAIMWKHKGTTIGGIVCGLKVVRIDNREIDWATAIVRALGCFLSLAVAGLGFIWVAIDDEKQSWHDKIAGTTVVHVPKGVSLL